MRGKLHLRAAVVAGALLAAPGPAQAQSDFVLGLGTAEPGASAPVTFDVRYRNAQDPEGKPPAISAAEFRLPAGMRIDTASAPRCTTSDAELRLRGSSACPADTRVGGGTLTAITGFGPPVDPVSGDVAVFNGDGELIEVVTAPGTDRVLGIDRLTVEGSTLTAHPPTTPGGPPDGRTAVKDIRLAVDRAGYAFTPPTCPADGRWRYSASFEFADGTRQAVAHTLPCKTRRASDGEPARPAIAVSARPGRARVGRRTTFRFVAASASASCRRGVKVAFAGRRARTNRRGVATIRTTLRRAGSHRFWAAKRGCATGRGAVFAARRGLRLTG